jgi:hypothetical protein
MAELGPMLIPDIPTRQCWPDPDRRGFTDSAFHLAFLADLPNHGRTRPGNSFIAGGLDRTATNCSTGTGQAAR